MIHTYRQGEDVGHRVIRLVTRREFIDEGLLFLDDYEQMVLSFSKNYWDDDQLFWLVESITAFYQNASAHQLEEVSHLAREICRVFERRTHEGHEGRALGEHTLFLVQAALSQLRLMLAPSLDGQGENALRIMTGLMQRV